MSNTELSLLLAGPMLRHTDQKGFSLWFVTSEKCQARVECIDAREETLQTWQVGEHCYINLILVNTQNPLKEGQRYDYDLHLSGSDSSDLASKICPDMLYEGESRFHFVFKQKLKTVIHGSCRKPHYPAQDSLPQLASLLAPDADQNTRPDVVFFTGDQVYVDDVAGPMLHAIQQCIQLLGLYHEDIKGSTIDHSEQLIGHPSCFYRRPELLPEVDANEELAKVFIKGKKKPVFTSIYADNHLIALNEMLALYLLSWSSRLWPHLSLDAPDLASEYTARYAKERASIESFCKGLPEVEKAFAHVPIYMIFDDHDVTDDWNLTRAWEEQVYGNPYSKRIIGNALISYFLCQGCGNPQAALHSLFETSHQHFTPQGLHRHDELVDKLFDFEQWHYQLDTSPPVHVLNTRTQRWRSESNANKPSGLMDWEALCELQQNIMGHESVIMISAAPIYGVKFIETIQGIFTFFGGALLVDAENWMAHKGTASVMLNMFRHKKTPPNFIILSGDVHYSFVYDVSLRFRRNSPKILQFTCSGIHNEFPNKLLRVFDKLNRIFYSHRSPLNFLTQRRNMSIRHRDPDSFDGDLVNKCALGLLALDDEGQEIACKLILSDGSTISFNNNQ